MENGNTIPESSATQLLDVRQPVDTKDIINGILDNIKSGNVNALEAFTVVKRMKKVSEAVLEDKVIKEMADKEFDKYQGEIKGGKSLQRYGASISRSAVHTYYDFSGCNHDELNAWYEIVKAAEQRIKQIEEELKLLVPKDDYKPGTIPGLGIQNTSKQVVFEKLPKLTMEDYVEVGQVEAPRKVQQIGLRYNKL
jgi:hypothetical protein